MAKGKSSPRKKPVVEENSEEETESESGVDLFNLRDEDLVNIDSQLKALDEEDDEEEFEEIPRKKRKNIPKKSEVDDEFFNLEEMERFLDEQDKIEEVMVTDDEDDASDVETDYRYADFFEDNSEKNESNKKKSDKRVRFAEDVDDLPEDYDDEDDLAEDYEDESDDDEIDAPVLFGEKEEERSLSTHELSRMKLEETIERIQRENFNPRSWELTGEVTGESRSKDSLLEKYIEVDFRQRQPPINTQEKTDKILSICLKRLKDKLFDDVERKYRDDDTVQPYRNMTIDMNERKSLMEVYEDRYQAAQNGEDDSVELDPQVKEVQSRMNQLFEKLDALTHFQYAPARVTEEVKIVKNMPSMRAEEVGPLATAGGDETLLAPEEVSRHVKSAPMAKDERTKTDKKRERRKKKVKQTILARAGKMPKMGKEKELEEAAEKARKSFKRNKNIDFFHQLQQQTVKEIQEKKSGGVAKKRKLKDRSETAAKYKA